MTPADCPVSRLDEWQVERSAQPGAIFLCRGTWSEEDLGGILRRTLNGGDDSQPSFLEQAPSRSVQVGPTARPGPEFFFPHSVFSYSL